MPEQLTTSVLLRLPIDAELSPEDSCSFIRRLSTTGKKHPVDIPKGQAMAEWLVAPGMPEDEILRRAAADGGAQAVAEILLLLRQLAAANLLRYELRVGDVPCMEIAPLRTDFRLRIQPCDPHCVGALSRFALVRRDHGRLVVESPDATARVLCLSVAPVAIIGTLARKCSVAEIAEESGIAIDMVIGVVGVLESVNMLAPTDGTEKSRAWDFHDRLFHARTRRGFFSDQLGARERSGSLRKSLALKPSRAIRIALPPPTESPSVTDTSLTNNLDRRQSIRTPGNNKLELEKLSNFLYRCLKGRAATWGIRRPYPCPGGVDVLRFYLWVARCEGLDAGLYRYGPTTHELVQMSSDKDSLARAMGQSASAMGLRTGVPDVVIVTSARYDALAERYQGITYRLCLTTFGAVLQTMYLVATQLNLAPCAVGTGLSRGAGAIAEHEELGEIPIGEFALSACSE